MVLVIRHPIINDSDNSSIYGNDNRINYNINIYTNINIEHNNTRELNNVMNINRNNNSHRNLDSNSNFISLFSKGLNSNLDDSSPN